MDTQTTSNNNSPKGAPDSGYGINSHKGGRPKKYEKVEYWGMKVTPEGKEKIKYLAKLEKKPASTIIMELVDKAIAGINISIVERPKKITVRDLRKMPKEEQSRIVEAHAKLGARYFEFEEDFDDFYDEE